MVTPPGGGPSITRPGHTLSIVQKQNGKWVLARSANMLSVGSRNIAADLWTKLIINCAYNAISALSRSRYGQMVCSPWTRKLMRQVVEEARAVTRAAGVQMPEVDLVVAAWKLAETIPNAIFSTA